MKKYYFVTYQLGNGILYNSKIDKHPVLWIKEKNDITKPESSNQKIIHGFYKLYIIIFFAEISEAVYNGEEEAALFSEPDCNPEHTGIKYCDLCQVSISSRKINDPDVKYLCKQCFDNLK